MQKTVTFLLIVALLFGAGLTPATGDSYAQSDLPNPAGALERLSGVGGNVLAIATDGTLAYIGEGAGLTILDVRNPASPMRLAHLSLPDIVQDLRRGEGVVYATTGIGGLQIIDVHDPFHPMVRGSYATPGFVSSLDVVGTLVYLVDGYLPTGWLQIIDASNPDKPALRGSYAPGQWVRSVDVMSALAYVAVGPELQILDVSNPAHLTLRGSFNAQADVQDVQVVGSLAYVLGTQQINAGSTSGSSSIMPDPPDPHDYQWTLQIVDISNPANPIRRGSAVAPWWGAHHLWVADSLAYIANGLSGVQIVDVSNPTTPTMRGSYDMQWQANDLRVIGTLAYVADWDGLYIIDASSPDKPMLRGSYIPPGYIGSVQVVGSLAYVADGYRGMQIIDISKPASPTLRGRYESPWAVESVQVVGTLAYIAGGTGLRILDVSNPTRPTLRSSYETPGYFDTYSAEVVGNLAYIVHASQGLQIVDVSDSAHPTLRGSYAIGGMSRVQVVGNLAYLVGSGVDLQIVDVSDSAHPTLRGSYAAGATDVQVVGNLAYIAAGRTLQIVDVGNPTTPTLRGSYEPSVGPWRLDVVGSLVYIAILYEGVQILDVRDAAHPILRGSYDTPGIAVDVQALSDLIYIADTSGGLQILRVHPELFLVTTTITPINGGTLTSFDRNLNLRFPAEAVTSTVTISYTGFLVPSHPLSATHNAVQSFTLTANTSSGDPVTQLGQPATLVFSYTRELLMTRGITDETSLNLATWNGSAWVESMPCVACSVDTDHNRVTVPLNRLGEFVLVGTRAQFKVMLPLIRS